MAVARGFAGFSHGREDGRQSVASLVFGYETSTTKKRRHIASGVSCREWDCMGVRYVFALLEARRALEMPLSLSAVGV